MSKRFVLCPTNSFNGTNEGPSDLALLQGVHHLDERFPSQSFRAHRRRYRPPHWPVLDDLGNDGEWEHYGVYSEESGK